MILAIIGLVLGLLIGFYSPVTVPVAYAPYVSIAILAALDSVFGGLRSIEEDKFDTSIFITGFFSNALLAAFLAYFGDRLGVPLYLAAIFAFGVRIFQNLAIIRRRLIERVIKKKNE